MSVGLSFVEKTKLNVRSAARLFALTISCQKENYSSYLTNTAFSVPSPKASHSMTEMRLEKKGGVNFTPTTTFDVAEKL